MPFCEVSKETYSFLILRHDIDASLEAALRMAKIENDLGIRSTYFVLFSHKLYNILEKDDLATLKEISKLVHEIGLHYDVRAYEGYDQDLQKTLEKEIDLLEHLLNRRVRSIAFHDVSITDRRDPFSDLKGYINAYDPGFCRHYVSDSCRAWFLEDLSRLLSFSCRKVQLLIHPFLWTEDVCARDDVLERLFQEDKSKNKEFKLKWLKIWHENSKVKNYDRLVEEYK
jgi:hypothetical protein